MRFFDENPDKYYSVMELTKIFKGRMNRSTIGHAVTKIIQRDEYNGKIKKMLFTSRRLTVHYGRIGGKKR